jgi:uncharacterized tellurite resistance protein B-like protein
MRSLFDSIKSIVSGEPVPEPSSAEKHGVDPLHLAACALLLDVAYADGEFSAPEIRHVEETLARHFGLSQEEAQRLLDIAEEERRRSVDHYQFTSLLQRHYDLGQKMVLAEVMWGLVLADGEIAEHEHYLTRKISNLLDLPPAYLASAKAAATKASGSA